MSNDSKENDPLKNEIIVEALKEVSWNPHPNDLMKEAEKCHSLSSKLSEHVYTEMSRFVTIIITGSSAGIFFSVNLLEKLISSDFVSTIFASLCAFSLSMIVGSFALFQIVSLRRKQGEWYDRFAYQMGCSARLHSLPKVTEGETEIDIKLRCDDSLQELKRLQSFKAEADELEKTIGNKSLSIGLVSLSSLILMAFGILNPIYTIIFGPLFKFYPERLDIIIKAFH